MKRFGSAAWHGGLRKGKGSVSTESGALETYPYTFFSRYGEKPGTNPEELLGAAHAACFTMSFVRLLGMANFVPEQVDSKSEVVVEKDGDGFSITSVHLTVTAKIPGIDQSAFQSIAAKAKAGCPVSKLMNVEINEPRSCRVQAEPPSPLDGPHLAQREWNASEIARGYWILFWRWKSGPLQNRYRTTNRSTADSTSLPATSLATKRTSAFCGRAIVSVTRSASEPSAGTVTGMPGMAPTIAMVTSGPSALSSNARGTADLLRSLMV